MTSPQNYISEDTTIKGSITTASSLTVAGAIEGNINAGGDVTILADASVKGDVSGPTVTVSGKVEGAVNASGRLLITAKGIVQGDIAVRSLLIEEGGTLQGQCTMGSASPSRIATAATRPIATMPSSPMSSALLGATPSVPTARPPTS